MRYFRLLFLLLLSCPVLLQGAVAFDAVATNGTTGFTAQTTIPDFTLTLGSISNGVVIVCLLMNDFSTEPTSFSITVGGNAVSEISSTSINQEGLVKSVMFSIATGPDSGGQTVAISWTNSAIAGAAAISFSGADQSTPTQNGTNTGYEFGVTSASLTITSATNNLTLDCLGNNNATLPLSPSQTSRFNFASGGNVSTAGSSAAGAASNDHDWTIDGARAAHSGTDVKAVVAVTCTSFIALMGVGCK